VAPGAQEVGPLFDAQAIGLEGHFVRQYCGTYCMQYTVPYSLGTGGGGVTV
jgi:hypothetical protein